MMLSSTAQCWSLPMPRQSALVLRRRRLLLRLMPPPLSSCSHAGPSRHLRRHQSSSAPIRPRLQPTDPHVWSLLANTHNALRHGFDSDKMHFPPPVLPASPLVVILITTLHMVFLNEGQWISNLLKSQFLPSEKLDQLDVLIGVVDGIPDFAPGLGRRYTSPGSLMRGSVVGSEGISVAVLDLPEAATKLWSPKEGRPGDEVEAAQRPGTLSFAVHTAASTKTFQLPLATTLFQNGRISTLTAQRWKVNPTGDWGLVEEKPLSSMTLDFNYGDDAKFPLRYQQLSSSLKRITPPRTISAAFGNIIRRIAVQGDDLEDVPASKELEATIQAFIQDRDSNSQKPEVWALIAPEGLGPVRFTETFNQDPSLDSQLRNGCRLHKVLSGGGGWGARQGLISLDPDSDYDIKAEQAQYEFDRDLAADGEGLRDLQSIVKPGESIAFYVHKTRSITTAKKQRRSPASVLLERQFLQFGTLPMNIDQTSTRIESNAPSANVFNHFGVLSRRGMSLQLAEDAPEDGSGVDIQDDTSSSNGQLQDKIFKTKVDAPYSCYTIRADLPHVHSLNLETFRRTLAAKQRTRAVVMSSDDPPIMFHTAFRMGKDDPSPDSKKDQSQHGGTERVVSASSAAPTIRIVSVRKKKPQRKPQRKPQKKPQNSFRKIFS